MLAYPFEIQDSVYGRRAEFCFIKFPDQSSSEGHGYAMYNAYWKFHYNIWTSVILGTWYFCQHSDYITLNDSMIDG